MTAETARRRDATNERQRSRYAYARPSSKGSKSPELSNTNRLTSQKTPAHPEIDLLLYRAILICSILTSVTFPLYQHRGDDPPRDPRQRCRIYTVLLSNPFNPFHRIVAG